ncbi:MAG: DUF2628 domain-containing protein [Oscillospiraceae bacterium]|nr:DUF2628 domain-containing protein [Oscillospiraceae bacterium]
MFCTKCGFNLPQDVKFCPNCGATVENTTTYTEPANNPVYGEVSIDPDVETLIGVKKEYYLPKFRQFRQLNKKTSWNWCAFLFGPTWFIYRKMYLYALCIWGVAFLFTAITEGSGGLIFNIATGILGNWLYMHHLEQRAREISILPFEAKQAALAKKSGVNKGAVIAIVIVEFVLIGLLVALAAYIFTEMGTSMDINSFIYY